MRTLITALCFLVLRVPASSLPAGNDLLPADSLSSFKLVNKPEAARLTAPSKGILQLETILEAANPWDVQAASAITAGVKKGDRILASFRMRGIRSRAESGEASTVLVFERLGEPWTKSADYPVSAGKEWRQIDIPFEAREDYKAGEAQLIFRLGFAPQVFEIRDLRVVNYGSAVELNALPRTRVSYPGREKEAPWRKDAAARIQQHRTANLSVLVLDKAGKALPNASIEIRQVKSAFRFGSAVSGHYMFRSKGGKDLGRYQAAVPTYFNMATEENAFKWQPLAGDWGKENDQALALQSADWIRSQGLDFRGHCLVWPGWRQLPKSLQALKNDPPALKKAVLDHIRQTALLEQGKTAQWDVMNEPFDNHDLMDILGDPIMVDFFRTARQAEPKAELFINDYAILAGGGGDTPHRKHYEKTIQYLVDQGAPFDGIGMQGHFGYSLTSPEDLLKLLDRYARFGKKIMITEYDINIDDLDLAGDYTRDLLTILYSHPAVEGFIMWGFWDGAHWHDNAPLFKKDWTPKPAFQAWHDLVLGAWKTEVSGRSADDGKFSAQGHLGDYEIRVTQGAKKLVKKARLGKEGLKLTLKLD